jgi:hypothetical protein
LHDSAATPPATGARAADSGTHAGGVCSWCDQRGASPAGLPGFHVPGPPRSNLRCRRFLCNRRSLTIGAHQRPSRARVKP